MTLLNIWRGFGQRVLLKVRDRGGRIVVVLGMGPNGKMIGWYDNEDRIREFDPDDESWSLVVCLPI